MNFLDKLERKYGKYKIDNLNVIIIGFIVMIFIVNQISDITSYLTLDWSLILKGQIWRIFTFIFLANETNILYFIFYILFYNFVSSVTLRSLGSFKFGIYILLGIIFTNIACLIFGVTLSSGTYFNASVVFAAATLIPNYEIYIFFIFRVKFKYIGMFMAVMYIYSAILSPVLIPYFIFMFLNYIIFFYSSIKSAYKNAKTVNRRVTHANDFTVMEKLKTLHKCEKCGIDSETDTKMEFRYCSKCKGLHEYCSEHILNHEHITE